MNENTNRKLRRSLGLFALIAYGVGDILGAGIYALVGKIAGIAGYASWLAFGVALVVASLTALSYAELGRRYPRSGGESYFCQQAFRSPALALLIGWLVLCSGVVSLATVSRAFAGYLLELFGGQPSSIFEAVLIFLFLLLLGLINFWGIRQSSKANIVCTLVETMGLLLVLSVGIAFISSHVPPPAVAAGVAANWPPWTSIGQAAAVAFFAFIGFEDMVNVAEEVKSPKRNLPIAIIAALVIAGSIYILVVWVATAVVPPNELAASQAPLLEVVRRAAPAIPIWAFTMIALFAVANTGLLNFIMASRLLYGMSQQELVPNWLSAVHAITSTPHRAIGLVFFAGWALASSGTLVFLAGTTSVLLLLVFFSVNLALIAIKRREPSTDHGFRIPIVVPGVAAIVCLVLICFVPLMSLLSAASVLAVGILLVLSKKVQGRASRLAPPTANP